MPILNNNRQFLSGRLVTDIDGSIPLSIEFKEAKDGNLVPVLEKQTLHSLYKPERDGERLVMQYRDDIQDKKALCIAIGLAGAYHLIEVVRQGGFVLVVCLDPSMLVSVLSEIDLSEWFTASQLRIVSEKDAADRVLIKQFSRYFFLVHPVLERIRTKEIIDVIKNVKKMVTPLFIDSSTKQTLSRRWIRNALKLTGAVSAGRVDIRPLQIDNRVIVVTGAGPSLSDAISILLQNRQHLFIAAADTSLKPLLLHGIVPDALFTFDAQNWSAWHFTTIASHPMKVLGDISALIPDNIISTPLFSPFPLSRFFQTLGWQLPLLDSASRNIGGAMIGFFRRYFPEHPCLTCGIDFGIERRRVYSRGTSVSEWLAESTGYTKPVEGRQAELLYQYALTEMKNGWMTTSLFMQYAEGLPDDLSVTSFSTSPYQPYKIVTDLMPILNRARQVKPAHLDFILPDVDAQEAIRALARFYDQDEEFQELCRYAFGEVGTDTKLMDMAGALSGLL